MFRSQRKCMALFWILTADLKENSCAETSKLLLVQFITEFCDQSSTVGRIMQPEVWVVVISTLIWTTLHLCRFVSYIYLSVWKIEHQHTPLSNQRMVGPRMLFLLAYDVGCMAGLKIGLWFNQLWK